MKLITIGFVLIITQISKISADYYWRDYDDGKIPHDAFVAGKNKAGQNVYVGQVIRYFPNENGTGLLPVQINAGATEVFTYSGGGVAGFKVNLKILCATSGSLKWITTNSINFERDVADKKLVKGGRIYADYYIGKITDEAFGDRIGSVEPENAQDFNKRSLKVMYAINEKNKNYAATNYFKILIHDGDKSHNCGTPEPFNVNIQLSKEGDITCQKLN